MAPAPSPVEELPPVALEIACQASTADWQLHLEQLFNNARDRFPDVVWELLTEGDALPSEEVWGHKAMVYARAPPTFQARYFSFRPAPVASPSPYGPSPMPAQSAVSLALSMSIEAPSRAGSSSPNSSAIRPLSPATSTTPGQLLRLTTTIASALFSQELEYLYTGKSFGDAFEFLFDSPEKRDEGDGEKNRLEKLRKDLVFMWRSRLYSDVRIQLSGNLTSSSSTQGDPMTTAVFSSHRFILVSRSPYFRTQLLGAFAPPTPAPGQPLTLTLPSPPFTPASLHFTLGYIYTGTLSFSHRTYDLETAFHVMRAATYLSMASLYAEVEARIVEDMCHGLFHAYMPFDEYENLTAGKWGVTGCKCRQCARRAPRVLEFATLEDVQNEKLTNGARRTLVGLFGDGWCTPEFAALPQKARDSLLRGVQKRTIPLNVFPLLYAAQRALTRLNSVIDPWAHTIREVVLAARKNVDDVLCEHVDACFEQPEWLSVMDADGGRFEDGEKVDWVMDSVRRGLTHQNAAIVYQTLVSSILLRPHPEDPNATVLSNTSGIRQQVEITRMDIVKWMRLRWVGVQQEGGFENLEGWALKELSHGANVQERIPGLSLLIHTSATQRPPRPARPIPQEPSSPGPPSPQPPNSLGATLNVGIPCIISSKRSRFRAFARYIGELEGERGSWVGVEIPVGEGWGADKLEGRQWNDGTWGGRRYFDIGAGLEWDESEERRKRRKEGSGGVSRDRTLKREGEQLVVERTKRLRSVSPVVSDASTTESRGLFVRPQDVIYVVDAESDY
ncbi:hypothetical protein JB92DRAFT_2699425 [Gautieria morchelliformis]|nr:hypothetical protein JB92DRAFT_2699425 [Gautieria morchelliformis]